jgi:flagellar hook-length control protein FliK
MKSDAMASSFFDKMISQNRMDRTHAGVNSSSASGSGVEDAAADFDFKAVYKKVASMNAQANKITNANTLLQDRKRVSEYEDRNDTPAYTYAIDPEDHFKTGSYIVDAPQRNDENGYSKNEDGPASALEANKVIGRALSAVSKKLHLSIAPELQQLSITSVSSDTVQQLSDIMAALKGIAGMLDDAVAKNQGLDMGSQVIDASQAKELGSFIQSELFKLEIGVGMLGAGDRIRDALAQKMSLTSAGDITQALDPAKLSMSQVHAQKVFGDIFDGSTSDLKMLVEKIRELCSQNGQSGSVNLNVVSGNVPAAKEGPAFMFDGAVMRALLNIDGKTDVADENLAAATQNAKLNLGSATLLAKDGSALKDTLGQVSIVDGSAKGSLSPIVTGLESKTQGPVYRTLDESVMRQIADKMNTAYRTGVNEIRIQLRPGTMGEMKLSIRVEGDVVFAKIQVENQQIKQIVENNMQFLKDSLSQQHLQAGSLDVSVGGDSMNPNDGNSVYSEANERQMQETIQGGEDNPEPVATATAGDETGRRFGDNTVEYFA